MSKVAARCRTCRVARRGSATLLELGEARRDEVHVLVAAREVDARLAGAVDEAALARVQEAVARDVAGAGGEDAELHRDADEELGARSDAQLERAVLYGGPDFW